MNFPFLCGNIPHSPAYGVFISQLIRYARACSDYIEFLSRARLLSSKLLKQGYTMPRLVSSTKKFFGRYFDLVEKYNISVSRLINSLFAWEFFLILVQTSVAVVSTEPTGFDIHGFCTLVWWTHRESFTFSSRTNMDEYIRCRARGRGRLPFRSTWSLHYFRGLYHPSCFFYLYCLIVVFFLGLRVWIVGRYFLTLA